MGSAAQISAHNQDAVDASQSSFLNHTMSRCLFLSQLHIQFTSLLLNAHHLPLPWSVLHLLPKRRSLSRLSKHHLPVLAQHLRLSSRSSNQSLRFLPRSLSKSSRKSAHHPRKLSSNSKNPAPFPLKSSSQSLARPSVMALLLTVLPACNQKPRVSQTASSRKQLTARCSRLISQKELKQTSK